MKTIEAAAILNRLGEKGILNKTTLREITKDISAFLKDRPEENRDIKGNRK